MRSFVLLLTLSASADRASAQGRSENGGPGLIATQHSLRGQEEKAKREAEEKRQEQQAIHKSRRDTHVAMAAEQET